MTKSTLKPEPIEEEVIVEEEQVRPMTTADIPVTAVSVLNELLNSKDEQVRLAAAQTILAREDTEYRRQQWEAQGSPSIVDARPGTLAGSAPMEGPVKPVEIDPATANVIQQILQQQQGPN